MRDEPGAAERAAERCPAAFDATWRERLVVLGGFFAVLVTAAVLGFIFAPEATSLLGGLLVATLLFLGKFLPLVAIEEPTFGFYELGLVIWVMDTVTVLVLVYSLEALYRWRFAARMMGRIQTRAAVVIEAFPRIRRYATAGMVLFVLFPVSGTGAIGGTFLGILLGLHRARIIAAVCLGGFLGGFGMAFLAERFGTAIAAYRNDPWVIVALVVLLLGAVVALNRAYRRALRRHAGAGQKNHESVSDT